MLEAITHRDVWMQESILPLHNIYVAIRETIMDRARIDIWEDVQRYDDDKGYRQVPNIHIHLPEDLSLVSTTGLDAANARIAELEKENTNLYTSLVNVSIASRELLTELEFLKSQVAEMQSVYDAVRRLEAWNNKTWHFYTMESYSNGIPGHLVTLSREGRRLTESVAETLAAAINAALQQVEGESHE